MRAILAVLSLLVVLAIIGSLAKKQLQSLGVVGASTRTATAASQAGIEVADPGSRDGAMAGDVNRPAAPQQSKALQEKVRDDTVRAMQQGADRTRQRADQD